MQMLGLVHLHANTRTIARGTLHLRHSHRGLEPSPSVTVMVRFLKSKAGRLYLTSPTNGTAFGKPKNVESKAPNFPIAIFICEDGLSFDAADSQSFAALVDLCIEFGQQHQGRKYKALNQWSWWSASRCSTGRHFCVSSTDYV